MTDSPVLLRDVIDIPTGVHQGDLVFRLADAAANPARTARDYVVTDQLKTAFLDAVRLVRSAVDERASKAAYLHGSFGSGKSNFMGVLQLLLDGAPAVRAMPELADIVANLDSWRAGRRFLTVPFHLIGEQDLESAVFGQYVRYVAQLHPDAPPPAVYADEPLFANAEQLRADVGDDVFFRRLSAGASDDSGWGDLSQGWDAASFAAARVSPLGAPDRVRLVQALTTTWLSSFGDAARANRGGYVGFADGLSAISRHAEELGYDGVILFLDELILWFLSRLGDTVWLNAEASKLSKLVEASSASRPVPIVSVIARQRDLRTLVGDGVPGAERLGVTDQLDFQAGRFDTITLDDSNLTDVAHHRLLAPKDAAVDALLRQAFASLALTPLVHDTLLAESGDDAGFGKTYPFSPAFMTVVVDVAGALQRTRTGLRVLLELLVDRRDELTIGQLVPVGDLYDVIADSDDPLSEMMRAAFDQARKVYATALRPALLAEHGLGERDEPTSGFRADDRLVKTLLLAALVSGSVPFHDLTVARLVALNHGQIASPVPGQETAIVTNKLRRLASQVGELRLGTDPNNPTVSVALTEVDTRAILATADAADNPSARRTLVRRLVFGALGLPDELRTETTYRLTWRGLPRDVVVAFHNLRDPADIPDSQFVNDGPEWKLVVDFPFDEPGHSPLEDLERLERFGQRGESWWTIAWLPSFFTAETRDTLGRLVRLDHVLANSDRFNDATAMLSPTGRAAARPLLEAMQSAARSQIEHALLSAYGITGEDSRAVERTHTLADHFVSLRAGLRLAPPTVATMAGALDQLLDQALRHTYPGAPPFDGEIRPADVRKVADLCRAAVVEQDGRLIVREPADRRLLTRIANPLQLGVQSEQAFTLQHQADHWDRVFTRAIGQASTAGGAVTVATLRDAIEQPDPTGLTTQLQNLVILVWAQARNRRFVEHGSPAQPTVDRLDDHWTIVERALPDAAVWHDAHQRLAAIFGVVLPTTQLSGFAVERAGAELARLADAHRTSTHDLVTALDDWRPLVASSGGDEPRLATARSAEQLIAAVGAASDDLGRVEALAAATVHSSATALGRSIATAPELTAALRTAQRQIIESAFERTDGAALRDELATALRADEYVTPLVAVLRRVEQAAIAVVTAATPIGIPDTGPVPPPTPSPGSAGTRRTWTSTDVAAAVDYLAALRARLGDGGRVEVTVEWSEPDGTA